jgi:hypothetical protein
LKSITIDFLGVVYQPPPPPPPPPPPENPPPPEPLPLLDGGVADLLKELDSDEFKVWLKVEKLPIRPPVYQVG